MILEETMTKLRQMKLHTMATSISERLNRGDHQDLSPTELIGLIVDDEWLARENRKLERRLQRARFKIQAGLEGVDYQIRRGLTKSKIMEMSTLKWIGHHQNVLILGPTGVGKSFIAQALGHHACQKGYAAHYIRMSKLLHQFYLTRAEGTFGKYLAKLLRFDVLIIDDWGIGSLKSQERRDVLEIMEDRHEIKSTVIASQLPTDHWHEFVGDETIADAICDRLIHNSYRIEMKGESVRKLKGVLKNG